MKKNWILLLLVLLLGGTAFYLLREKEDVRMTTLKADRAFAVEDVSKIGKIFIADRSGTTTTLERKGDEWIYNGKYGANKNTMANLLETIKDVEMKYIPTDAAIPGIIKEFQVHGIKVELYDRSNVLFKTYYVGGMTNDELGTYFIMEDSDQPYVMEIPYMDVGLKYRYLKQPDAWKNRHIFEEEPESIKSVSVIYPLQQLKSFELTKEGADFRLSSPYDDAIDMIVPRAKAEYYLESYRAKMAEAFMNDYNGIDSVRNLAPFAVIDLKLEDGENKIVRFTPVSTQTEEAFINKYFADCNWGDFFSTQHRVMSDLFIDMKYFTDDTVIK